MACKTHKVSCLTLGCAGRGWLLLYRTCCIESTFSVQFQILRKLSQDPVATAIPSSVTPRQLTRLSWPASTPEKVQLSVHTVYWCLFLKLSISQLWKIIFYKDYWSIFYKKTPFQFFYLKMLLTISLSKMVKFTSNLSENRFYTNFFNGKEEQHFCKSD